MRVLFLYPRTLGNESSVGGVAEFLSALTPLLAERGVEPFIYTGDKSLAVLTKPQQVIPATTIYSGPFIKPGLFVSSRKLMPVLTVCKENQIDIMHAQGTYTAGFMALQIYKRMNIPYVVTSHSDILVTNSKRILRDRVQHRCRQVLKHTAFVTHLTPMMAEVSHQLWNTQEKSRIIGNGIDSYAWQAARSWPEKNYMLGIGRLERGKGFHILIEMYAKLIAQGVDTSLVIAGKGSEEKNLQAQVRALGLHLVPELTDISAIPARSVIFAGYVRDELKKQLMAQSQLVLFATQPDLWEEAFGIVQLEAMAAGKPMIASKTLVTQYLQDMGMQVMIVEANDVDAWVKQALGLLQNVDLRKKLGELNANIATQFDWQPIAKQYHEVYGTVLNVIRSSS